MHRLQAGIHLVQAALKNRHSAVSHQACQSDQVGAVSQQNLGKEASEIVQPWLEKAGHCCHPAHNLAQTGKGLQIPVISGEPCIIGTSMLALCQILTQVV